MRSGFVWNFDTEHEIFPVFLIRRRISLWNKLWHQWVTWAFRNAPWPLWSHVSKFKSMKLWRGFIDFRQAFLKSFFESSKNRWVVSFFLSAIEARKYFLSFSMTSPVCSVDRWSGSHRGCKVSVEWSHKAWSVEGKIQVNMERNIWKMLSDLISNMYCMYLYIYNYIYNIYIYIMS